MIKISIVLPTYNERENLPLVIAKIEDALKAYDKEFEIIVVDDNSPDKTYAVARQIAQKNNHIQVIHRIHEKGLSSAILDGFSAGIGNYLITMDSDMQHDEIILPKMIQAFEDGFDIVIGSRKIDGGEIVNWTLFRKFISWIASFMAKIILGSNIKDPMSGYFGLKRDIFEKLMPSINPRGFKILMEFIAKSQGLQITEIGYSFRNRQFGKSKLSTGVMIDYLIALYELSFGRFISLQFLKYSLVGLLGVFVNQMILWLGIQYIFLPHEYALIVSIELSIITNFFLNNRWTFKEKRLYGAFALLAGLAKFNIICLTGAIMNYSIALFFENKFGINIYWGNLIGIVVSTVWNYIVNIKLTWEKSVMS